MKTRSGKDAILPTLALLALIAPPVYSVLNPSAEVSRSGSAACPSGRSTARLTGWMLNDKTPIGSATYNESAQKLDVSVDSVALADGLRLAVLIGEERIGELEALKGGSARGSITRNLQDDARVRVFNDDRPIVSGNLVCDSTTASPTPTSTVSPSPSPTATPTLSPTPTPADGPTVTPSPAI